MDKNSGVKVKKKKSTSSTPDELWKKIIEELFEDFVVFFMPDLYPHIDFSKGYTFLDKELLKLFPQSKEKRRYPDHLVRVFLKDGTEQWILIHIEVQGYKEDDFSHRMFTYFYRIYDKYKKNIVTLCIFTDNDPDFKPSRFEYNFFKTKVTYEYRTYKLLDQDDKALAESDNPFAMVALVGLYHLKSGRSIKKKFELKIKLLRLLLTKNYPKEKIKHLFIFLDNLLTLPEKFTNDLKEELIKMTGGKETMGLSPLDSPLLREIYFDGYKIGEKKGERKGVLDSIQFNLKIKFGSEAQKLMKSIEEIKEIEELKKLFEKIVKAKTIDEVKASLRLD